MSMKRVGDRAFTIVELLIVIVVIAILAAITLVAYNGIRERAEATARSATLQQVVTWIAAKRADTGGVSYPADLTGLNQDPAYTYEYFVEGDTYCAAVLESGRGLHVTNRDPSNKYPGPCPAGHWRLAGDATDIGLYGVSGSFVGSPTASANQKGIATSALTFGSGNYVSLNNSLWADQFNGLTGGFAFSAWVRLTAYPGARMTIIGQNYSSSAVFGIMNNGRLFFRMDDSANSTGTSAIPLNQWTHVAVSYDAGAGGVTTLYINGVQDGQYTQTDTIIDQNTSLSIGWQTRQGTGADDPFTGAISDVSWYKRTLTASEVAGLYEDTK